MPLFHRLRSLALGALLLAAALAAPGADRFLDAPRPAGDGPRLAVFNPSAWNLRCLEALRRRGILKVEGLTVVGVYHERQKEDFQEARRVAKDLGLDWLRFHEIAAPITEAEAFRRNACTPEFEALVQRADGVIFFGGPDIPSSMFGLKTHQTVGIEDPFRHYLEVSAVWHLLGSAKEPAGGPLLAARPDFAVLGICLGFQTLNVGTGGTLVQDIPAEIYGTVFVEDTIALGPEQWHNNPFKRLHPLDRLMSYNFHTLNLTGGTLARGLGLGANDHPRVLSSHHQALGLLGAGWTVTATSRDGRVVEAIEHRRFPGVLGVQFHPEHHQLWEEAPRFHQRPGDPGTSYHALLAGTPGSLELNRGVWAWFAERLLRSRGK